jgi:two-component system, sporulation sensor kinase E
MSLMPIKKGFIEKLIDRMDRVDAGSLQTHFARLAGEKGLLETIFHSIQEGIIVLDESGCIQYANRGAEKLLSLNMTSAEGQPIRRYLREVEWDLLMRPDDADWSRLMTREIELSYPEHRFVEFYVVPLSLTSPGEEGAVVILRDVTRERETQAHNVESEKLHALTLLAAGVAHEIGNPLNALNIHLQLIERELREIPDDASRENLGELLDVARNEINRLDQIIHQFLRAVRPTQPQFEAADIRVLVKETLGVLRQQIKNRGVLIEEEYADDVPAINVDHGQIKQAFFNIIKNALEAMSDGGMLKVTVFTTERFVAAAFKDSGPGIEPDHLGEIFTPYHTTKTEGNGLGLMIVQRIVREHGGEIEVDSRPGEGTTFVLYLPNDDRRVRLLKPHPDIGLEKEESA